MNQPAFDVEYMLQCVGEEILVQRFQPGTRYIGGRAVDAGWVELKIIASVQPMTGLTMSDDQILRRTDNEVKIYTVDELKTTDEINKIKADIITYKGMRYEIQSVENWLKLGLTHWKSIGRLLTEADER